MNLSLLESDDLDTRLAAGEAVAMMYEAMQSTVR
jgi:hypothetical protein